MSNNFGQDPKPLDPKTLSLPEDLTPPPDELSDKPEEAKTAKESKKTESKTTKPEEKKPEPKDPPKEESTSLSESVNIFNQQKANLVNEIENRKPDATLVTSSFELPQEPLVITDEEIKEFDVNFGDVITDIQKKRKSKITNTCLLYTSDAADE